MYNYLELKPLTQHLFGNVFTGITWSVSTPCARTNPKVQSKRNNVQL